MGAGRRITRAVGCSALAIGVLVASADVASAGTVRQRARVVDAGWGYANSGGNYVVDDASTNNGVPSTSGGTATVDTGKAKAKGNVSSTTVRRSTRRR